MVSGQLDSHVENIKLAPFTPYIEMYSKWIRGLNVLYIINETVLVLEESMAEFLYNLWEVKGSL